MKATTGCGATSPSPVSNTSKQIDALKSDLVAARARIREELLRIEAMEKSLNELGASARDGDKGAIQAWKSIPADSQPDMASKVIASTRFKRAFDQPSILSKQADRNDEPISFRYKGLNLTPGGFLEASVVVRSRNENADIANTYTGVPLDGSSNSRLTEFRGSARDSRLSLLMQGNAGLTKLTGYIEGDFLGAAPTANFVQASAFTPRLRQAWVQLDTSSGWTITGGQFWSLMTTDRSGIATRNEYIPNTADGSYVVGYNWVRERSFRLTRKVGERTWLALEIDDPENTYSAAFVPANVMGLNTSPNTSTGVLLLPFLANYSNGQSTTAAPDLLAKVAFDRRWGHFEGKALGRLFRDRIADTASTPGHTSTTLGYGFGFAAILPVVRKKADVIAEGLFGQGIGRYGAAGLPDVTIHPTTGEMLPLREAQMLAGIEIHPRTRVDFYAYAGNEYAGRYALQTSTGAAAGYGSRLISYSGCTNEVAMNSCNGANRDIQEVTGGYWFRLFKGSFGTMQYGNQVAYTHRSLWDGVGTTPRGSAFIVYSTMRFYLP